MDKTITNILLTNTLLSNIINLENSITEKDCTIINLRREISNLKIRIADLLEQNRNLEQERFNLSVLIDELRWKDLIITETKEEKDKLHSFAEGVSFDVTNETQLAIFNACKKLCVRLIEKNKVGEKSTVTTLQLLQAFMHIIK